MSFCAQDFSVLAYANGFTHWHYRTRDSLDQILRPCRGANDNAYFAAAAKMLRPGDQITVNLQTEGCIDLATLVTASLALAQGPVMLLVAASCLPAEATTAAA
nr:hypothetical protein [uncultured Dongia sp.]